MHSAPTQAWGSIWRGSFAPITVGAVALIFLAALQSLAVATIMPVISAELDGQSLYALAFAGTLATGVIGMVVSGAWCDRSGPVVPLSIADGQRARRDSLVHCGLLAECFERRRHDADDDETPGEAEDR